MRSAPKFTGPKTGLQLTSQPASECIVRGMESLSFTPGRAFLSVNSTAVPWTVVFEDEGVAAYFYACDRSQRDPGREHPRRHADLQRRQPPEPRDRAAGQCRVVPRRPEGRALPRRNRPGALRLRGPRAATAAPTSPTSSKSSGDTWRKSTHAWSDSALQQFEAALYA